MRKAMILGLALAGTGMLLSDPAAALRWGMAQSLQPCWSMTLSNTRCWSGYKAILWDIPWGKSWEQTCKVTPHTNPGWGLPTLCQNDGLHIWGVWKFSNDPNCSSLCGRTLVKGW